MRTLLAAVLALAAPSAAAAQAAHAVVFDSYMTPAAGAEGLLALQGELAALEDRWIPRRFGSEESRRGLALGILYRSGKFLALDLPQDHFLMVVAHEVFGHGARFRELGDGRIRYGFDAPIPYGAGEAFTSFRGEFPISPLALLTASSSGIEAQHSLADRIQSRAVATGRLHYREAWLYFESRVTGMTYILTASPTSSEGHDVADFVDNFEKACRAPCVPLTRNYLQRRAFAALADPMVYYAIYGFAASYIGRGALTSSVPMIPVGAGTRVLPSLGYALAPYGAEWTVRAALHSEGRAAQSARRLTQLTLRVGNTGASTPWALRARVADLLRLRRLPVAASVDLWRQPDVVADQTSDPLETGIGIAGTATLRLPARLRTRWSDRLEVTFGYKSQGYVPGEQLSGGGYLRAGITMSPR